ncbi:unnamed protein product [Darwinula stevensoni]|uniref:BTB domain-containing protein n=1 Tax=Darwinula stevensoni TaxID=69355 RepID=A0A7R8XB07_9CRUS|nr:unnamed protein product [Darwinula stevensoni]CAG0892397.1 unnamed protein product [Darwinula stevensoni]
MSNKYNLKWNSHHVETFQSFENLRHREMFVDVTLSCNGQFLKAHKLVLCAGSGYFERVLNKDGSGTPTVHFYGIEMHLLKLLVEFMYCGEVEVPAVDLEKFIEVAENLEVKGLKGDKSKSSGSHGISGTTIPVSDVHDALAHKRKSAVQAWSGLGDSQPSPAKIRRPYASLPQLRPQFTGPNSQQKETSLVPSKSQVQQTQPESSMSSSIEEVLVKDEGEEDINDDLDVMDPASVAADDGHWDEQSQGEEMEGNFGEGIEMEPDMPKHIPPEVDPQAVSELHVIPPKQSVNTTYYLENILQKSCLDALNRTARGGSILERRMVEKSLLEVNIAPKVAQQYHDTWHTS